MPIARGKLPRPACGVLALLVPFILGQMPPDAATLPAARAEESVKIIQPAVDRQNATVTIAGSFWNQNVADWVEVALSGRPSDFLHETLVCVTTTRDRLEQALRDAGCRDADAWATNVREFPRIRGDHLLVLVEFVRDGKKEAYSLDELLAFQGWGVSVGPYGFLFRGDPGGVRKVAATRADAAADPGTPASADTDAMKILRDDPQIALVFKGLQSMSQSFADHTLAYDDWIYPAMNLGRNYAVLPAKVFNSNGDIPVTITIQKVTEAEFLTQSARVWHDAPCSAYILRQLPTAQALDKDKAVYWGLLPDIRKAQADAQAQHAARSQEEQDKTQEILGRGIVLLANIEKNYTILDAAWGQWSAEHAKPKGDDPQMAAFQLDAKHWSEHLVLKRTSAAQRAMAETAAFEQKQLARQPQTDATKSRLQQLRGDELIARSAALIADNQQPADYWDAELARINPEKDPRTDWVNKIMFERELADARRSAGELGTAYGKALQANSADIAALQSRYAKAIVRIQSADLRLQLAELDFEIRKREGFDNDPDLPALREKKSALESRLKLLQSAVPDSIPGGGI